jgi:hypothetical protein
VTTQALSRVIRDCLTQVFASGAPNMVEVPFSGGVRLQLARRRVRGTDELLAPFPMRAPTSVWHYLFSSRVDCPDLPEEDRAAVRDEVEAVLFRYLNPLSVAPGVHHTIWLLSETEHSQLARILALSPEEEADFIFLCGASAQWTGPIRGLHKTMGTLAAMLSRHPDFVTGKVVCRPPLTFLFLGETRTLERLPSGGITMDGRMVPARGVFALDTTSYMDALVQVGEEEARDLAVVEFQYAGPCLRAHGPLGIPLYRIPHTITSQAIRSVMVVATGQVLFQALEPALEVQ